MSAVTINESSLKDIMNAPDTTPLTAATAQRPTPFLQTERGLAFSEALGKFFRAATRHCAVHPALADRVQQRRRIWFTRPGQDVGIGKTTVRRPVLRQRTE